jgi:hypothetical protein
MEIIIHKPNKEEISFMYQNEMAIIIYKPYEIAIIIHNQMK